MTSRRYTVVTGYYARDDQTEKASFFYTWHSNTMRWMQPCDIYVINAASAPLATPRKDYCGIKWIDMAYNAGHMGHLANQPRLPTNQYCGWSLGFMTGLTLALANGSDLIYKEQDCLVAGAVVDAMYKSAYDQHAGIVCGAPIYSINQHVEQSLVLVKQESIAKFLSTWLSIPGSDGDVVPETKWGQVKNKLGREMAYFDFGWGRNKHFKWDDIKPPFFLQKITPDEVNEFRKRDWL